SRESLKQVFVFGVFTLFAFFNSRYIAGAKGYLAGGLLSLTAMGYSYYELRKLVDMKAIFNKLLRRQ
ncbi:hypothetical protein KAR91_02480, partial [Candidatus Pacearchaeota archaeon]|nr:hypothetical protein [Candidatus Pacearchaeota archaeon]